MDFKSELSKILGPELTGKVKALYAKHFNAPVAQAAPIVQAAPVLPPVVDPNAVAVQAQEAVLADGTTIKYDTPTLAVGSVVTVVSPDGEMPAPAGELTLQDGTKITVSLKEGKAVVESVTPGQATPQAPAPVVQTAPDIAPIIAQMQAMEKKFKAQEKEKNEVKAEFEAFKKEVANDFKSLLEVLTPILNIPSADPLEKPVNKFQKKENPLNKYINRNN